MRTTERLYNVAKLRVIKEAGASYIEAGYTRRINATSGPHHASMFTTVRSGPCCTVVCVKKGHDFDENYLKHQKCQNDKKKL